MMKLSALKDKKILILGFGKEGQDTFRFLKKLFPKKKIGIADRQKNSKVKIQKSKLKFKSQKLRNINWHLGKNYLTALKDYDVIIKSPGIPFKMLTSDVNIQNILPNPENFLQGLDKVSGYDIMEAGKVRI